MDTTLYSKNTELPIEKIADFCDRWSIIEFALFGSVLRNDFRDDSDIDILVTIKPFCINNRLFHVL
jgi:predicted nucleotidyltransferase